MFFSGLIYGVHYITQITGTSWNEKINEKGLAEVTAKGEALFLNNDVDIKLKFHVDRKKFTLTQILINDVEDTFFSNSLLSQMCEVSKGEENITEELAKLKKSKAIYISKYLFKHNNSTRYSPIEQNDLFSKYYNQYIELPLTLYSIKKVTHNIYDITGFLEKSNENIAISIKLYTSNKKEVNFLESYTQGENINFSDDNSIPTKVLIRGKYKVYIDEIFNEITHKLDPAILILE